MRWVFTAGLEVGCEDVGVAESAVICAVCRRSNIPGNHSAAGDVFICVRCQADAAQFIAIQDPVVDDAGQAADSRHDSNPHGRQHRRPQ